MASSKVYFDGESYVALVAHSEENPAYRGATIFLTGLLHYVVSKDGERVEIFDDEVFYEIDNGWNGLDWGVVDELLNAAEGLTYVVAGAPDDDYYNALFLYSQVVENELVRESLA